MREEKLSPEIDASVKTGTNEDLPPRSSLEAELMNRRRDDSLKLMNVRFSFWFFRRIYFVLILGAEKRNIAGSFDGYHHNRLLSFLFKILIYILVFLFFLLLLSVGFYLIKSGLGIDIYPEKHMFELFFEGREF